MVKRQLRGVVAKSSRVPPPITNPGSASGISTVLNRHRFTVAIQHGSVQYRSNVVESNHDTILFVVMLESIRYLQYWNENTIE